MAILKEQTFAYKELVNSIFQNNQDINESYSKYIHPEQAILNAEYKKQLSLLNSSFFAQYNQYTLHYNKFQNMIYVLPQDVINATLDYYGYISDLFENHSEDYLGTNLIVDLNQKAFDIVNTIRQHMGIDVISASNMNILSSGKD